MIEMMYLVPVETTLVTDKRPDFDNAVCVERWGYGKVPGEGFYCMVNVWGCRFSGIRPMPV